MEIWTDTQGFERYADPTLGRSIANSVFGNVTQTLASNPSTCIPPPMFNSGGNNESFSGDDGTQNPQLVESLTQFTDEFEIVDAQLKTAKNQLNSLVDNGSTSNLLSNIHSRWNRDTVALRQNILNQSPNISTEALLAIAQLGTLNKATLMQVLLANPSACKGRKLFNALKQEIVTPLNDAEIRQLQNARLPRNSRRFELENTINFSSTKRARIAKQIINELLTDSEGNKAQLRYWWNRLGTRHDMYNLAESYTKDNESNRYEATIRVFNRDLAFSDMYVQENQDYIDLYSLKSRILKSGRNLRQLNQSEIVTIRRIANNSRAEAAVQANNILCFAIGECKHLEIPRLSQQRESVQGLNVSNKQIVLSAKNTENIAAYPNPTHGILTMDLKLPNSFGKAFVSMLDLTGQEIIHQVVEVGQAQIIWQTEQMKEGLYFLILKVDNQITGKSKIIIQK